MQLLARPIRCLVLGFGTELEWDSDKMCQLGRCQPELRHSVSSAPPSTFTFWGVNKGGDMQAKHPRLMRQQTGL